MSLLLIHFFDKTWCSMPNNVKKLTAENSSEVYMWQTFNKRPYSSGV